MFFDKERQKQYEADLKEWKNNGADDKSKPKNPFEQEAKQFLADMKIKDPENLYSAIGHLDNGMYYVSVNVYLGKVTEIIKTKDSVQLIFKNKLGNKIYVTYAIEHYNGYHFKSF